MIRAKVRNMVVLPLFRREIRAWEGKSLHKYDNTI